MSNGLRYAFTLILLALLAVQSAAAQETRGVITGRVSDATGVIPNARVTATHTETNTKVEAVTTGEGTFTLPYLAPGHYTVAVELEGFKRLVRSGIELRISDRLNLDLQMEVGGISETVTVTGEAAMLETSTATSGQIVDRRRIAELPLAEGNPMTLVQLAPGIVITGGYLSNSALSSSGPSNFELNGAPGGNEFTLDGSPNTADRSGNGAARVGLQPPTDAVEEFKVVTANFDAQQGRTAGASVDVAVRSGTNQLHGTGYEFVRHDSLAANTFFNNREGKPKQSRRYNRTGVTLGGPVLLPKMYNGRNKTFFFVSYERIRPVEPTFETLTVPTEDFRRGDFSSLLNRSTPLLVYDPLTARREGGRIVRDPIQCNGRLNVICPDRISPVARTYLSYLPLPNTNLDSPTNNYYGNGPADNQYRALITRGDHQFNDRNRMFVRYSETFRTEIDENSAGIVNGVRINGRIGHRGNRGGVVDYVYVPSSTTIVNVRGGVTRFIQDRFSMSSFDLDIKNFGFSQRALGLFTANTSPQMNVSNYSSPVEATGFGLTTPTWSFQPTVTKLAGSHAFRVGYDFRVYQEDSKGQTYQAGQYDFANDFTRATDQNLALPIEQSQAQGMSALLLGLPTSGNFPLLAGFQGSAKYHGVFVQDDWKITPKLSLNLGLRYEIDLGTIERQNRFVRDFDETMTSPIDAAARAAYALSPIPEIAPNDFRLRGGLLFPDSNNRSAFNADKNNIQPRVGAAYMLNSQTVIRGGWGMFMVPFVLDGRNQSGFSTNTPLIASPDLGLTFTANLANPFPSGYIAPASLGADSLMGQNLGTILRVGRKNGMLQRWEVSVQRELPSRWLVEGTYIGNYGYDLVTSVDANPILRQYQSTSQFRDQTLINFLDAPVTNPFRGIPQFEGTSLFSASVIARSQLLRPYPQYGNFNVERYDGSSTYKAAQARIEKRFSNGYTFTATYALSRYLEKVTLLNPTDTEYEERLNSADVPHRLALSGIWELPFGRGRAWGSDWKGLPQLLLGGLQVQGIYQYQSGLPLTIGNVYFNGDLSSLHMVTSGSTIGALGTSNVDDNVFETDLRNTGFYPTDDTVRTNGQLDYNKQRNDPRINLANNIRTVPSRASNFRGQPTALLDLSVIKNFEFSDRVRLQFRVEAINALNNTLFSGPVLNPRDANFGRVTSTATNALPREFQLGLRLVF